MSKTVVIVGGVAGGASCAARLRRVDEAATIIVLERGPHVSFANCGLPYFIGGEITGRDRLFVTTAAKMARRFRIDIRTRHEVLAIRREEKRGTVREHDGDRDYSLSYDALVLSPGASPLRPPIPGIDGERVFSLRTVGDADAVRMPRRRCWSASSIRALWAWKKRRFLPIHVAGPARRSVIWRAGPSRFSGMIRSQVDIPAMADEDAQSSRDVVRLAGCVDGINIKLMECGGLREALRMIHVAKTLGMRDHARLHDGKLIEPHGHRTSVPSGRLRRPRL